jgi:DNA-binding response OmpR family regulator
MSNKTIVEDDDDVTGVSHPGQANHYDTFSPPMPSSVSEALKHQPDLMILDLVCRRRFHRAEWFRSNTYLSVIPVIVVSARDERSRNRLRRAKAFMQKPWNDQELSQRSASCRQPEPVAALSSPLVVHAPATTVNQPCS